MFLKIEETYEIDLRGKVYAINLKVEGGGGYSQFLKAHVLSNSKPLLSSKGQKFRKLCTISISGGASCL